MVNKPRALRFLRWKRERSASATGVRARRAVGGRLQPRPAGDSLNSGYFGIVKPSAHAEQADAVADIGAALILHLREHPGASEDQLLEDTRAARPDRAPDDYWVDQ